MKEKITYSKNNILQKILIFTIIIMLSPSSLFAEVKQPTVTATSAIVMDYDTGQYYYEKNSTIAKPVASMTKLMSMYIVFEEIAKGNMSLDSKVIASKNASDMSKNYNYSGLEFFKEGSAYKVDTLIRLIMTSSANASVIMLAENIAGSEVAFVKRMNEKAKSWGIDAKFADCTGFKDEGNAVSPKAMAFIAQKLIQDYPQILNYSKLKSTIFQGRTFKTTNLLLYNDTLYGIDGLKTGTTKGAGYCFTGTAQRNGKRLISVVYNSDGYNARMNDTKILLEYGFEEIEEINQTNVASERIVKATITPNNVSMYRGSQFEVQCNINSNQEFITNGYWYMDGQKIHTLDNIKITKNSIQKINIKTINMTPGYHTIEFRYQNNDTEENVVSKFNIIDQNIS